MRRSLIGLILAAALAPAAHGQAVVVDVSDGAVQRFEIAGPARISYTGSTVVITFGPAPAPTPNPPPAPRPGPAPTPEPLPPIPVAWGPLDRIVILCESSRTTGREPIYAMSFADALSGVVEKGKDGYPRWRCWDRDLAAPDSTVTAEAKEWSDALAKAKAAQGAAVEPIVHAIDKDGRVKSIPLKGLTDEDAAKAIRGLIAK